MTFQERHERCLAIVARVREIMVALDQLPKTPVAAYLPAKMRRHFRRHASRLRAGKAEPLFGNLFTGPELARICELTAQRDEFLEGAVKELTALAAELRALLAENEAEIAEAVSAELLPAKDAAAWHGPGSHSWDHFREIQNLRRHGQRTRNRAKKPEPPQLLPLPGTDYTMAWRNWISAAQALPDGAPAGETVLRFPEGADEDRVTLRIGVAEASWIGSFNGGLTDFTTVQAMPDNRTLLVVAKGAGYQIDAASRCPVADLGRDIAVVARHEESDLLLLDHAGTSLEAFGAEGWMWSSGPLAYGGFREFAVVDGVLSFEARQADGEWVEVGIDVATGDEYVATCTS